MLFFLVGLLADISRRLALFIQDKPMTPFEIVSTITGIVMIALLGIQVGKKR